MSFGDEHGYGGDSGRTDDGFGGTGQTRTRLPDGRSGDMYGGPRRPARSSRSLITVVGVVVLLIAAIAFANRGGGGDASGGGKGAASGPGADPTAATGVQPVTGKNGEIPSGFARNEQGAASAAANYAVVLGSVGMFNAASRQDIIRATHDPATADGLLSDLDRAYSPAFLTNVGLNEDGSTPADLTFVSRTVPVGTKVTEVSSTAATVEVWSTGLVGLAGEGSTKPVTETWFTITEKLKWIDGDWKISSSSQTEGPTPVNGDNRASTADEIAKAVQGYGGFTYAR
ncbi:hypothetical protein OIE62_19675 [Streptomyces scopuliridis]|uniref:Uncharacterized protein n=1 Tax=Streptomyces scopuliridis TaxID=452529 RepID=A0ACD4ZMR6_9ACTN|nr:hypothetical protein [Streptomyces scopuliridis]WSB99288.1 hypothetical protein OG835_21275 [Streptomyces scopuliridis]WSC07011.1 hypothetical protein OIE62_19675 [Streptomyces scopuliridis]